MSDAKYAALRGLSAAAAGSNERMRPTTSTDEWHPTPADARRQQHHRRADGGYTGEQPIATPAAAVESIEEKQRDGLPVYRGPSATAAKRPMMSLRKRIMVLALSSAALLNAILCLARFHDNYFVAQKSHKTNVILMISDGYGPAGQTFTRSFAATLHSNELSLPYDEPVPLPLDKLLIGTHRSRSSSSLITDSAAGATAFSCAKKSYNGAIGVDQEGAKCGTLFEAAKQQRRMLTGVVVTSRLTDATPAAFVSHASSRALETDIAAQEIVGTLKNLKATNGTDRVLDLAVGGGGCNFLARSHPFSCREDAIDLIADAKSQGWDVWSAWPLNMTRSAEQQAQTDAVRPPQASRNAVADHAFAAQSNLQSSPSDGFEAHVARRKRSSHRSKSHLPFLGLLAPSNTLYEIDRLAVEESVRPPALKKLAMESIEMLDSDASNTNGFIVMIEGSQIDLCAHSNDGACHAREILAYQETIAAVTKFVEEKNAKGERTLLISTSDHETGGLTLGRQLSKAYPNYAWYPRRLAGAKQSAQVLSARLYNFVNAREPRPTPEKISAFVRDETLGVNGAGFTVENAGEPTEEEVKSVVDCLVQQAVRDDPPIDPRDLCRAVIADTMSRRAEIGWSTSGHTGVDINVYAHGPGIDGLRGNIENTDIGVFIAEYLGLDLRKATKSLA